VTRLDVLSACDFDTRHSWVLFSSNDNPAVEGVIARIFLERLAMRMWRLLVGSTLWKHEQPEDSPCRPYSVAETSPPISIRIQALDPLPEDEIAIMLANGADGQQCSSRHQSEWFRMALRMRVHCLVSI